MLIYLDGSKILRFVTYKVITCAYQVMCGVSTCKINCKWRW